MNFKNVVKYILQKCNLLDPVLALRSKHLAKKRRNLFVKNRLSILGEFDALLTSNGISYSLAFGTLLGAVREKGFIPHDEDIDVAIWKDTNYIEIERVLTKNGFSLIRRTETDNGNFSREDTYMKKGVLIDVFTFYPYDDKNSYTTVYIPFPDCKTFNDSMVKHGGVMPVQLILPFSKETERIPFENIMLPAINNREDFIEAKYGKNWRIPTTDYEYTDMGEGIRKNREDKVTKVIIWK